MSDYILLPLSDFGSHLSDVSLSVRRSVKFFHYSMLRKVSVKLWTNLMCLLLCKCIQDVVTARSTRILRSAGRRSLLFHFLMFRCHMPSLPRLKYQSQVLSCLLLANYTISTIVGLNGIKTRAAHNLSGAFMAVGCILSS